MRITSGKYKGRKIFAPKGIRPTQEMVRKALFDILGDVREMSFLELFAGSGAVGFEAISRGAKEVLFVDNDRRCVEAIKKNLSLIGLAGYEVVGLDAQSAVPRLGRRGKKFDIIFLDPPYSRDLAKKILQILGAYDILAPDGFVVAQHFKREDLPAQSGFLLLYKHRIYGSTHLSFYKRP